MLLYNWVMNIFSIVILIIIKIAYAKYGKSVSRRYGLFMLILYVTILLLLFETPARYDGLNGAYWPAFNAMGNFMLFLLSPIIPSLWIIMAYNQVYNVEMPSKRILIALGIANLIHFGLLLISQFTGWFYSIDAANIYHRGPVFLLSPMITIGFLVCGLIFIIVRHKQLTRNILWPFIIFPLPAVLGVVLQSVAYGIDFSLKGLVASILVYFIFVLTHQMTIDYLTGVYNRKGLDDYLEKMFRTYSKANSFTAIMLDLDDFKSVNDKFGHAVGDEALKTTALLIKSCLTEGDFVARYGGDEFFAILENSDQTKIQETLLCLQQAMKTFNEKGEQDYLLCYSLGVVSFDPVVHHTPQDFKKDVDRSLYENKKVLK